MPSSVIAAIKYNVRAAILRIIFVSGKIYDYKNVPEELFNELKAAASKGTFLNKKIKGRFEFEKVG
jgi:hypothetical protein